MNPTFASGASLLYGESSFALPFSAVTGTTSDPVLSRAIEALRGAHAGSVGWEEASRHACALVGADAGGVIAWRKSDHGLEILETHGYDPRFYREYTEHYFAHDLMMDGAERASANEWIVSDELYPRNHFGSHVFFGDFLSSHRVDQIVALVMSRGEDQTIAFTFARQTRQSVRAAHFLSGNTGAFARAACELFVLRERAVNNARLTLQDVLVSDTSLCFLADDKGRVRSLDGGRVALGPISGGELFLLGSSLQHRDPRCNERLACVLKAASHGRAGSVCLTAGFRATIRVQADPAPGRVKLTSGQALALVRIERRDAAMPLDLVDLQQLFGLTPAQARVLVLLCDGRSAKECAEHLGCGVPTIRSHIAQLLERMGCSRQSQVVRLAMMVAASGARRL